MSLWLKGRSCTWPLARIKDHVNLINGWPFDSSGFNPQLGTPVIRIRDVVRGYTDTLYEGEVPREVMVQDGDLVVGMDGDFNSVVWQGGPAALNQRLCLLRARPTVDQRFLAYFIDIPLRAINAVTFFTTVKHLSSVDLLSERMPLPSLPAQRRIADFLDRETERIDALVDKKRRLADLLEERVPSHIEDRVQQILRKHEHVPLKHLAHESDMRVDNSEPPELLSVSIHLGVVPRSTMTDRLARADTFSSYKVCRPGDIVINRMRAFQGGVGVATQLGMVSADYTVLRLTNRLDPAFAHHLLRSPWFVGEMTCRLRGIGTPEQGNVRTPRVRFSDLGEIPFPVPPINVQRSEESILTRAVESTARLNRRLAIQLSLLTEYREALITAAVTGEIDVDTFDTDRHREEATA